MPTIRDMLQDDLILDEVEAGDKAGVLRQFARLLKRANKIDDEDELVRVLQERETLGSTGIGDGIAIPHAKLPKNPDMMVAFGRSRAGIDFDALDAKPVNLFFVLVTPEDRPGDHLKALARISRIMKNPVLRGNLKTASDRHELKRLLVEEDSKYPQPPVAPR